MARRRGAKDASPPPASNKPIDPSAGEVEFWLAQFDDEKGAGDETIDGGEIFPAGYGEDVEE
jgi:hypothetical protein